MTAYGPRGLNPKPVPGSPPKLTAREKQRIPKLLLRGAFAWGFRTELWTTALIADVIHHSSRNQDELVWAYTKRALANGRPLTLNHLFRDVMQVGRHVRRRPTLLRSFILGSDLPPCLRI